MEPIKRACMVVERLGLDGWYAVSRHCGWDSEIRSLSNVEGLSDPEREWVATSLGGGKAIAERDGLRYLVMVDMRPVTLTEIMEWLDANPFVDVELGCSPLVLLRWDGKIGEIRQDALSSIVRGEMALGEVEWWTPDA